jgi:hypothetical protein
MAVVSILRPNGILYGHLVNFVVIWKFFPVLVCCTEKNLATLGWAPCRRSLRVWWYRLRLRTRHCNSRVEKSNPATEYIIVEAYTLAGFEPTLFRSGGGRDDHNATPPTVGISSLTILLDEMSLRKIVPTCITIPMYKL